MDRKSGFSWTGARELTILGEQIRRTLDDSKVMGDVSGHMIALQASMWLRPTTREAKGREV